MEKLAAFDAWWVEVSDGLFRKTPPEMTRVSELPKWQQKHSQSQQGLRAREKRFFLGSKKWIDYSRAL